MSRIHLLLAALLCFFVTIVSCAIVWKLTASAEELPHWKSFPAVEQDFIEELPVYREVL